MPSPYDAVVVGPSPDLQRVSGSRATALGGDYTITIALCVLGAIVFGLLIWWMVTLFNGSSDSDIGEPGYSNDTPEIGNDDTLPESSSSDSSSSAPSQITTMIPLVVKDLYGEGIPNVGLFDADADTYLGKTDENGHVTVQIQHYTGITHTTVVADAENISPQGTRYHCTKVTVSLSPTSLATRQVIEMPSYSLLDWNNKQSRWEALAAFLQGNDEVANATYNDEPALVITYSFVQAGTTVQSGLTALDIKEYVDGAYNMTEEEFKAEIVAGFALWEAVFADKWPSRPVFFRPVADPDGPGGPLSSGDEPGTLVPTVVYGAYNMTNTGVGDIRISMIDMPDESTVLAYAYAPRNTGSTPDQIGVVGSYGGDMMFNARQDWRTDTTVTSMPPAQRDGYSVKYVFAHEFGHALGLGHDAAESALMAPYARQTFSMHDRFGSSLLDSRSDMAALEALYNASTSAIQETAKGNCTVMPVYLENGEPALAK
jgi:hypothetical protein